MAKKAEYELMPIKPIKELKREFQKLKNELKTGDKSDKILTKVLNSNVEINKKLKDMVKEQRKDTNTLKRIANFFESVEAAEDAEDTQFREAVKEMRENNKLILEQVNSLNEEIRRHRYFIETFPRGLKLVYQRTR